MDKEAVAKLAKDREKLIQSIRATIPFAVENGDGAALNKILEMIVTDPCDHFLSYSQECSTSVSYADKPDHKFDNRRRRRTTLGRYIRRVLVIPENELSSAGLTLLTGKIFSTLADAEAFQEVTGIGILEAYRDCLGGGSCMTDEPEDDPFNPLQIYAHNPDKVALVLYRAPDLPENANGYARALLWTCDDGSRVLDRIYPDNRGVHVAAMRAWATSCGYCNRRYQGMPDDDHVMVDMVSQALNGRSITKNLTLEVTLQKAPHGRIPYLDTFHWGVSRVNTFVVTNDKGDQELEFDGTHGGYSDIQPEYDWYCGRCGEGHMDYDSSCSVRVGSSGAEVTWCEYCVDYYAITCARCEDVVPTRTSRSVDGEPWCPSCIETHANTCESCDTLSADTEECHDGYTLCAGCRGTCEECGEIFRMSQLNGEDLCPECAEKKEEEESECEEEKQEEVTV